MQEIWKDIKGYEGLYQVSDVGNIKSLNYNKTKQEKNLKFGIDTSGYRVVNLFKNGKPKMYTVHKLVAITFIPNPNDYPIINHKDENRRNNNIDNLEWCTYKYNLNYGERNKKVKQNMKEKEKKNGQIKRKKVTCITTGEIFKSVTEASMKTNAYSTTISQCCKGKRKHAGKHPSTGEKLMWEYV